MHMRYVVCLKLALLTSILLAGISVTAQVALVSTGAVWKFLDTGGDPGPGWIHPDFDDATWPSGPAQLGFGDGDEATTVDGGPTTNRHITTFFRRMFTADPEGLTNLALRVLRDDGVVVYLNGREVFRNNMPWGEVFPSTLALRSVPSTDESANYHAQTLDPSIIISGANLLAVEVHQFSETSTDLSFDLMLFGNFAPQPPVITILSPQDGVVLWKAPIPIKLSAQDYDSQITTVELFSFGTKIGGLSGTPWSYAWRTPTRGEHLLTAVATDSTGLATTSAPVRLEVPPLAPEGAFWKFLDDGTDPGAAWRSLDFDDNAWKAGSAHFGFGDGDETTVLSRTNALGNPNITFYFRHGFEVPAGANYSNLVLRCVRDDGAVVYLNGNEIFRSNMDPGPVTTTTLAARIVADSWEESEFYALHLPPDALLAGTNLLAVEIHQAVATSSDISFDLQLTPNVPPTPPSVRIIYPGQNRRYVGPTNLVVEAYASDFDDRIANVQFLLDDALVGAKSAPPYEVALNEVQPGSYLLRAIAQDLSGLTTTSAPVNFVVLPPPLTFPILSAGSSWRYLDDGLNPSPEWISPGYNDTNWKTGRGKFGYGDPAATTINGGRITTYFRHQLLVTNGPFSALQVRVLRDDGAVVYINGQEAFRMNMPTGAVSASTLAINAVGGANETTFYSTNLAGYLLAQGANTIAVELHQNSISTTDAGFDLAMDGTVLPATPPEGLRIERHGSDVLIIWDSPDLMLEATEGFPPIWVEVVPSESGQHIITPSAGSSRFFRVRDRLQGTAQD